MKKFVLFAILIASVGFGRSFEEFQKLYTKAYNSGNYEQAAKISEQACNAGYKDVCYYLGEQYEFGKDGVTRNPVRAIEFYEKACSMSSSDGCNALGVLYNQGRIVRQDDFKSFKYNKKACELGSANGCYNVGLSYGKGEGARQSYSLAREYFGKACDMGYSRGCEMYSAVKKAGY